MPYLKAVAVTEELVEELWDRVSTCGSFYSIGDGASKEHFRKMLFRSNVVLRGEGLLVRLENGEFLEMHPIVTGHSAFRHAVEAMQDLDGISSKLFNRKPVCAIIPNRMKGARALARAAGMMFRGTVTRNLSGVPISCGLWR